MINWYKASIFVIGSSFGVAPFVAPVNLKGNATILDIIALTLIFIILLSRQNTIRIKVTYEVLLSAILLFLVISSWIIALFGYGYFQLSAIGYVLRMFYFVFMICFIGYVARDLRIAQLLLMGLLAGIVTSVLWGWFVWLNAPRFHTSGVPMYHVISYLSENWVVNRNYAGYYIVIGFPIALTAIGRNWLRNIVSLLLLITGFLTFSKGTWLGLLSVMFVACILTVIPLNTFVKRRLLKAKFVVLSMIVMISATVTLYSVSGAIGLTIRQSTEAFNVRVMMIKDSLGVIPQYPIFGAGPKSYFDAVQEIGGYKPTTDPHNTFLWLATEIGLLAAVIFIIILVVVLGKSTVRYSRSNLHGALYNRVNTAILLGVVAISSQTYLHGLPFSTKATWVLVGICAALTHVRAESGFIGQERGAT